MEKKTACMTKRHYDVQNFKSNLMAPIRQAGHTSMSDVNWTISADCSQGNPELPEGLLMSSLTNEEEIEDWDNVKRVMGNDQYREKALSSCKNDADRTSSPCSVEAVDSVYRYIYDAKLKDLWKRRFNTVSDKVSLGKT